VRQYGQAALEDFKATGHRYLWSYFINNWGNAERTLGNHDQAKRLFQERYDHMQYLGTIEGMTTALNNIANIAMLQEDYDEARQVFEQKTATYRDQGDIWGIALTLEGLGRIAVRQNARARAAQLLSEALQNSGTSLDSITLSILIQVSRLFLKTDLQEQAFQILGLVMHHPASSSEVRDRAQRLLASWGLNLEGHDRMVTLENLVDEVTSWLNTHEW
jgi:tetratricopeptide (TPR) repeat protein